MLMTTEVESFQLPVTEPGEYPDDKRVRLRGDRTEVYSLARAGAEGWVRAHRYDPIGKYRMVFIEWDASHWSYNDQGNMWAFEDHFESVKDDDKMSQDPELKELVKALAAKFSEDETDTDTVDVDTELEEVAQIEIDADQFVPASDEQFTATLRAALGAAKKADSFLIFTVSREQNQNGREALMPSVYKSDKAEDTALLLGAQVSQVASLIHQELAVEKIRTVVEDQ